MATTVSAPLDWSQCPAVESIPGKMGGAWLFKDTRFPVSLLFENLEAGMSVEEIMEQYDVRQEEISAVLTFTASSAAPPTPEESPRPARSSRPRAHTL